MPRFARGFTLVEMLVVVAVLGILSITVVVVVRGAHLRAVRKEGMANVVRIAESLERYYADGNFSYLDGSAGGCPGVQTYLDGSPVGILPLAIQGDHYEYEVGASDPNGDGLCERWTVTAHGVRPPVAGDAQIALDSSGVRTGPWG